MALPSLINGAECGPTNPLQHLSKQFDKDRGAQQDQFGRVRAGPSREVFRTTALVSQELDQEASQFFSNPVARPSLAHQYAAPNRFDLSSLQANLPFTKQVPTTPQSSLWAGDFLAQGLQKAPPVEIASSSQSSQFSPVPHYETFENNYAMNSTLNRSTYPFPAYSHLSPAPARIQQEFNILPEDFPPEEQAARVEQVSLPPDPVDPDELSRTAGELLEAIKHETNPKFQNSAFLGLMRRFRDREAVIEGTDVVVANSSFERSPDEKNNAFDIKGKGREVPLGNGWADAYQTERNHRDDATPVLSSSTTRKSVRFDQTTESFSSQQPVESEEDRYWRQENADFQEYWSVRQPTDARFATGASVVREALVRSGNISEWDKLQSDWDNFEATASGIKPIHTYELPNETLTGMTSTRTHRLHSGENSKKEIRDQETIAWYELGVKQQENEREQLAIVALLRAVGSDPSYSEAWLALAISHTNEGDKKSANNAIERWVRTNERYGEDGLFDALESSEKTDLTDGERNQRLIRVLMNLINQAPKGEIDADLQTALGVLLNTSEDYEKAYDCFRTALSVKPDDWLLYNRVGATLANSGRASEAVWYYHQALTLNPSYIRARFNLGISCINMKHFDEAARHILDALVLQENEAVNYEDPRGHMTSTLWECLRTTCMQLQRPDLAIMCDSRNLEAFRQAFLKDAISEAESL